MLRRTQRTQIWLEGCGHSVKGWSNKNSDCKLIEELSWISKKVVEDMHSGIL